jgi:hypothetical protein
VALQDDASTGTKFNSDDSTVFPRVPVGSSQGQGDGAVPRRHLYLIEHQLLTGRTTTPPADLP